MSNRNTKSINNNSLILPWSCKNLKLYICNFFLHIHLFNAKKTMCIPNNTKQFQLCNAQSVICYMKLTIVQVYEDLAFDMDVQNQYAVSISLMELSREMQWELANSVSVNIETSRVGNIIGFSMSGDPYCISIWTIR